MRNQKMVLFLLAASVIPACGGAIIDGPEEPPPPALPVTIEHVPPGPRDGDLIQIRWTTKVQQEKDQWHLRCQGPGRQELIFGLPSAEAKGRPSSGIASFGAPTGTGAFSCVVLSTSRVALSNVLQFAP